MHRNCGQLRMGSGGFCEQVTEKTKVRHSVRMSSNGHHLEQKSSGLVIYILLIWHEFFPMRTVKQSDMCTEGQRSLSLEDFRTEWMKR